MIPGDDAFLAALKEIISRMAVAALKLV